MRPTRLAPGLLLAAGFAFLLPPALHAQSLQGSRASIARMADQAHGHGLRFHGSGASVRSAVARGELVRLAGSADYDLADVSYPYVLPVARTFVERLGARYRAACGEKLVVTSALRPTSLRLANSTDLSVHPTGMAVDLRRPSNARCLSWLRSTLLSLEGAGAIEATEERNPPHFHVAVYPRPYQEWMAGGESEGRLAAAPPRQAAPAPAAAATYRVRRGDSLWEISRRHGVTVQQLRAANHLKSDRVRVGQRLVIPRGTARTAGAAAREKAPGKGGAQTHTVRRGETLWEISRRHGVSVKELKAANALRSDRVEAGRKLTIPAR